MPFMADGGKARVFFQVLDTHQSSLTFNPLQNWDHPLCFII